MARDRGQDVLRAATMYYLQDMTMDVIGRRLGTSRSTVSRMLRAARDSGLVEITLRHPADRATDMEKVISTAFGIEPYIVPTLAAASEPERLEHVARMTARLLSGWFDSDMVLGVAWGTTTVAVSRYLPAKKTTGSTVVQLNGAANTRTSGLAYAGELLSTFGAAFDAHVHDFPVPAFFDFAETKRAMWRERTIRRVLEMQQRTDVALFSVGAIAGRMPSHVYSAGYLDPEDVAALDAQGVVGDVCTVFLRSDGSYRDIELNERASGPTPEQLRRIPRRVCVVASESKVVALLAALRAGLATDLIVDEGTAAGLIAAIESPAQAPLADRGRGQVGRVPR